MSQARSGLNEELEEKPKESLNNYELAAKDIFSQEPIGNGSFGWIMKGEWQGKAVAVKKSILPGTEHDESEQENLIMQKLDQLGAVNVVKYYGFYRRGSICHIVMEYIPKALSHYIDSYAPLGWSLRYRIMLDISRAIEFMHKFNIVHGDIKSPNVLVSAGFKAKLCDFGSAKIIDNQRKTVGTITHMAPEIMEEAPYTDKADIYSLSFLFWEMAAWCPPFRFIDNDPMVMRHVLDGNREQIPKSCPPAVAKYITLGWAQQPDKRPAATEIIEALEAENDQYQLSLQI